MKALRGGVFILAILVLLDAALVFFSYRMDNDPASAKTISFTEKEFIKIEIRLPGEKSYQAIKKGDAWLSDTGGEAKDLAESFREISLERIMETKPADLGEFGLEAGTTISAEMSFPDGGKTRIFFGKKLPLDILYVYASVEGQDGLYKVLGSFRERCEKAVSASLLGQKEED
jgi:hypothetical protein